MGSYPSAAHLGSSTKEEPPLGPVLADALPCLVWHLRPFCPWVQNVSAPRVLLVSSHCWGKELSQPTFPSEDPRASPNPAIWGSLLYSKRIRLSLVQS